VTASAQTPFLTQLITPSLTQFCTLFVTLFITPFGASAQGNPPAIDAMVEGRVSRATQARPIPVAGQWVVLHRVGADRSAPLDSVRTDRAGTYRFRYQRTGDPNALYFVSARFAGIAYFSTPLRIARVSGGDADIIVYETTTDASEVRVQGRHLVVSAPRGNRREVAEVFELDNGGIRTVLPRDSTTPSWSVVIPERAESVHVAPGDLSAAATAIRNGRAELYAPISPGVRQLVLTYRLPPEAFPLARPLGSTVSVLEVLLEEPRAIVEGAGLAEVAPASIDQRMFRRFLAQDVSASGVMRVKAPPPVEQNKATVSILGVGTAVAMLVGLAVWASGKRSRSPVDDVRFPTSAANVLIAELATLDSRFNEATATAEQRAQYEQRRSRLKAELAKTLAAEKPRS
jgi:hypothetical protein